MRRTCPPFWSSVVVVVAAFTACSPASHDAPTRPPDVLVLMIDTLRADHVRGMAARGLATPTFDRLVSEGVYFDAAYSTSAWTLPAVASLFVSQLGSRHGVVDLDAILAADAPTLARTLAAAGYRTGAWSASRLVVPARGVLAGFEDARLVMHPEHGDAQHPPGSEKRFAPAEAVNAEAIGWIRRVAVGPERPPFFAYLHYLEPHTPYLCGPDADPGCRARAAEINAELMLTRRVDGEDERDRLRRLYAADVERMDRALGELLASLEAGGHLDRAWVVIVADHGELLGEHGRFLHTASLHQPLIRIPLLLRGPDLQARTVREPVSIIDVAPTLAELAGVPAAAAWDGRSLVPALRGESLPPRSVVAESFRPGDDILHRFAVVAGDRKWVMDARGRTQAYALPEDPGERAPIAVPRSAFDDAVEASGLELDFREPRAEEAILFDDEQRRALEALGYLH
jgi:arylsulfatase A-like enzyme